MVRTSMLALWMATGCAPTSEEDLTSKKEVELIEVCELDGTSSAGTSLTADIVTYYDDIAPIVETQCATSGCHAEGAQDPALATLDQNVANASASLAEILDGTMPPGVPLDDADQDLWQAWIDGELTAGSPPPDDDTETGDTDNSTSSTDDEEEKRCHVSERTLTIEDEDRLRTAATTVCEVEGFVFNQRSGDCSLAMLAESYACDRIGIRTKFMEYNLDPDAFVDQSIGIDDEDTGEGYRIYQCGEYDDGRPLVILIDDSSEEAVDNLRVREIEAAP